MGDIFDQVAGKQDVFDRVAPQSAASPIPPPAFNPSRTPGAASMRKVALLGGTSENPDLQRPLSESVGELGGHALQSSPNPVTIGHRLAQKMNIAPQGDLWPNEATMQQLPAAAAGTFFGMGAEPGMEPSLSPSEGAPPRLADAVKADATPGRAMRVGTVLAKKVPGVKFGGDLLDAWRGPQPVPVPPPPAPPSEFTTLRKGGDFATPQELRGKLIPPPSGPSPSGFSWSQKDFSTPPTPGPRLIEQMGGKPVETITEDASSRGIGQAEWESGHQIGREVENTPRPSLRERVRAEVADVNKQAAPQAVQDKSLLPLLKKSLQKVQAKKTGLAKAGD